MKILKIDKKLNQLLIIPENLDDLWHLEKIIDKKDIVAGKTDRKIKPSKEGEKTIRQTIFINLEIETIHFQEFSENLKLSGIILDGNPKEFVEVKSHHSIDVKIGDKVKIQKNNLKNWQIERLKKAEKESASAKMLVVLMDDELAELAFINQFSINKKAKITSKKQGKMYAQEKSNYFDEIFEKIQQLEPKKILVAGPGFVKDNFKKFVEEKRIKGLPTIITENLNSVGKTGFNELLSQGKLNSIEKELQLTKETQIIEEFLEKLSKNTAEYGKDAVLKCLNMGQVNKLIIAETFLLEYRDQTEDVMNLADKMKADINIISSKNPQERTIYNMGGIVATLRYKTQPNE
jgi:protein pelota